MSNWTEEREAQLSEMAGDTGTEVSQEVVANAAEALDVSTRSIGAKLRRMGYEVEKVGPRKRAFSDAEAAELEAFLEAHPGEFTYAEVAEQVAGGKFSAKQVQGKVLSMELTGAVAQTPAPETKRTYTPEEEATFISLAQAGAFLEDIAEAVGKTLASVRGKALSLTRSGDLESIPKQRDRKVTVDPIDALGDGITEMTVAQIAEATGKTEKGIKTIITRRGLVCADYKAKAKKSAAA